MKDYQSDYDVKTEAILPKMSKVIMLNDDYTTMEFVVKILRDIFSKSLEQAEYIMLTIHTEGKGMCGIYPYDIAQTKAREARRISKEAGYPLRIIIEDE